MADDPHWGHYDRVRQLFESLFESVPQACLQVLLVWRGIDQESEWILYASVVIALLNGFRNLFKVYTGARGNDEYIYDYIKRTLSVGVGHIPHIPALREGKGVAFDFSETPTELLIGGDYDGLRLVSNAIIVGGTARKICFTTTEYDLSRVLDLGRPVEHPTRVKRGRGAAKVELTTDIKIDLPLRAEEAEGKFLASVLEVHRTVFRVVVNVGSQQEVWESHDYADQNESLVQSKGDGDRVLINISRSLDLEGRAPRIKSRRVDTRPSFPVAAAHLVLAFVFHPTWVDFELYLPPGSACAFIRESKKLLEATKRSGPHRALFRALQLRRGDVEAGAAPTRRSFTLLGLAKGTVGPSLEAVHPRQKKLCLRGGSDVADLFTELDLLRFCELVESRELNLDKRVPKFALLKIEGKGGYKMEMVPRVGRGGVKLRSRKSRPGASGKLSKKQKRGRNRSSEENLPLISQSPASRIPLASQSVGILSRGHRQQTRSRPDDSFAVAPMPSNSSTSISSASRTCAHDKRQRVMSAQQQSHDVSLPFNRYNKRNLASASVLPTQRKLGQKQQILGTPLGASTAALPSKWKPHVSLEDEIAQERAKLSKKLKNGKAFYDEACAKVREEGGDPAKLQRL